MRTSRDELVKAAQEASGPFLRAKLGKVDWFVTLTFDRRAGRKPEIRARSGPDGPEVLARGVGADGVTRTVLAESGAPSVLAGRVSPERAMTAASWWRRSLGKGLGREVAGLFVVEPHSLDASAHVHGLVSLDGGQRQGDFQLAWFIWWHRYGYIRIVRPKSEGDVCDYCSKYAFKNAEWGDWRLLGRR